MSRQPDLCSNLYIVLLYIFPVWPYAGAGTNQFENETKFELERYAGKYDRSNHSILTL